MKLWRVRGCAIVQQAFVLNFLTEKKSNLAELNARLQQGWRIASQAPMGGGDNQNAVYSLVVLEQTG
ncbi:hypothetical protein [Cohnella sp. 56]|uniref:hypothetical protein n=1 Tax=Cohnella sp. 56 TaxID=3113722 RepID=UPI0030EB0C19